MPQKSEWGNNVLKPKHNQEHKEVEKAIFDKLYSLGDDAKTADGKPLQPNDIHKLDKSWQPFNAKSFSDSVKRCRRLIAEGKTSYDATNEDNVSAPTRDQPHTSVAGEDREETSAAAAASGTHADMLDLDSTESFFMSNDGTVQLPYQVHLLTHPPVDETGRKKYAHVLLHLLSGTHQKDGYSVGCEPKGRILFVHLQKGELKKVFWGEPGRIIVRDPIAKEKIALNCAQETRGFTDITEQSQEIVFPFEIRRVLKPRPFWVSVHNGPSGNFLGLYIKLEVDWNDCVADTTGEDYAEIFSPQENDGSFYSSASRFAAAPPRPKSATKPATPAPESEGNNLSADEMKALFFMMQKMGFQPSDGQIHVDQSIAKVQGVKPTPPKFASRSKSGAAKEDSNLNHTKTRLDFDSVRNLGNSFLKNVRKSASKTESTADLTVGYGDDSDLSEEAEEVFNEFD